MKSSKLKLRSLRPEDEASFKNAVAAFKNEIPPFEFAFDFDESITFNEYINKLEGWSLGKGLPDKFVPNTFLVGVVDGQIVGRLSLRHRLNNFLEKIGGHIGYGVIQSCRQQGNATEMLKQALPICLSLGIGKVLITCDIDNLGSQKVIEKCGGIFENVTNDSQLKVQKRRYWIDIK
ncbi:MAG: GNAT family N-acetyltransferase [Gammaproteobacteria bacterium]|nr:GNAT family N-acetyltransferase [Gammaproteobacteria bacterium]